MLSRREFVRATPLLLGAVASSSSSLRAGAAEPKPPEIGRSSRKPRAGDGVATLDVGSRGGLRVLQITDNHYFCGVKSGLAVTDGDTATERDWQEYVRIYKPDLIVSSGDLWHDNPGGRGQASLEWVLPKLERLGVPWAMCWGNHDQLDRFQRGHDALEGAANSLYRGGGTHGDYRIDIRAGSKSAGRIYLMNSNQFGLTAWQTEWLRRTRASLKPADNPEAPALAFFHIPLLEQKSLFTLGKTPGLWNEEVCNEKEEGQALPVLAEGGRIRACFCGHDHTNDYLVRARDVDLVYGRSTGHSGYGGEKVRKGAKIIELDFATGAYTQVSVFPDGTRWTAV